MRETWALIVEYTARVMGGVDWQVVTPLSLFLLLLVLIAYYKSAWHEESVVSKRRMQTRHKKALEVVSNAITEALEKEHQKGNLKRGEVDHHYKVLRDAGYKGLGLEPTFGKPWYEPVQANLLATKRAISSRLHAAGVNFREKLNRKPKETLGQKRDRLMASLKPVKT